MSMNMADPAVQDMLEEDKREALARIKVEGYKKYADEVVQPDGSSRYYLPDDDEQRRYNNVGMRLTDCCAAASTFHDEDLCCKHCWEVVEFGKGDGTEYRPIPTPDKLTTQIAEEIASWGCTAEYEHTGGNCGAIGVYRHDAGGMMEPIGAYLLIGGSEGPWPHSSAYEPLNVQWDGDPDPDWGDFEVFLYSNSPDGREIEALPIASVSGVDALVAAVVAWCKTGSA